MMVFKIILRFLFRCGVNPLQDALMATKGIEKVRISLKVWRMEGS